MPEIRPTRRARRDLPQRALLDLMMIVGFTFLALYVKTTGTPMPIAEEEGSSRAASGDKPSRVVVTDKAVFVDGQAVSSLNTDHLTDEVHVSFEGPQAKELNAVMASIIRARKTPKFNFKQGR